MESRYIFVVDMDYVDESDVVMFTVKLTLRCTREKTDLDHLLFIKKNVL